MRNTKPNSRPYGKKKMISNRFSPSTTPEFLHGSFASVKVILLSIYLLLSVANSFLVFSSIPLKAADTFAQGPQPLYHYEAGSLQTIVDVAIENNRAYLAVSGKGLIVLDVSNPSSPTKIGEYSLSGVVNCIDVENGIVYMGVSSNLVILNATDTSNIVQTDSIGLGSTVYDLVVRDGYVYAAAFSRSLRICYGNQTLHEPITNYTNYWCRGVALSNTNSTLLFTATENTGVTLWDISNKSNPTPLVSKSFERSVQSVVQVSEDRIIAGCTVGKIYLLRFTTGNTAGAGSSSTPSITILNSTDGGGDVTSICFKNDTVIVGTGGSGVKSYKLGDNLLKPHRDMGIKAGCTRVVLHGNILYGCFGSFGMYMWQFSEIEAPVPQPADQEEKDSFIPAYSLYIGISVLIAGTVVLMWYDRRAE